MKDSNSKYNKTLIQSQYFT